MSDRKLDIEGLVVTPIIHPNVVKAYTKEGLAALLWVRNGLASGQISDEDFDMRYIVAYTTCGTAHCILGWMRTRTRFIYTNVSPDMNREISNLVHDSHPSDPKVAVRAIDRFLTTGKGDWNVPR